MTMIHPLIETYCVISAHATMAYVAWGYARARQDMQ
jgi:hypothetical protein